ncbi:unnamed protein product, partial [marine sediment metagenome]
EDIKEITNEIKKSYDCKLVNEKIISKIAKLEYVLKKYAAEENLYFLKFLLSCLCFLCSLNKVIF